MAEKKGFLSLRTFASQKNKFLNLVGGVDKTVDKDFEDARIKWEKMVKLLQAIDRDLTKHTKTKQGFEVPFGSLSDCMNTFFSSDPSEAKFGREYKTLQGEIENAVRDYHTEQNTVKIFVSDYFNTLSKLKKDVQERDDLQLSYDKWRNTVKQFQEKPPKDQSKVIQANEKYSHYKESFESRNETLIKEINRLYEQRFVDFETAYTQLVVSQFKLYTRISHAYQFLGNVFSSEGPSKKNEMTKNNNNNNNTNTSTATGTPSNKPMINMGSKASPDDVGPMEALPALLPDMTPEQADQQVEEWTHEESKAHEEIEEERRRLAQEKQSPPSTITMKALYDFDPQEEEELGFKENDVITLLEEYEDSEWWKGQLEDRVGLFPSNYCDEKKEVVDPQWHIEAENKENELTQKEQMLLQAREQRKTRERQKVLEDWKKKQAEAVQRRKEAEERLEEERKRREEEERKRQEEEERKRQEEEERKRQEAERKRQEEEELQRKKREEEERKRHLEEEIQRKKREEEERKRHLEEETQGEKRQEAEPMQNATPIQTENNANNSAETPQSASTDTFEMIALYDFDPTEENEVGFREGQTVVVLEKYSESEWWKGQVGTAVGLFPSTFCAIKSTLPRVVAVFEFAAQEQNELSFHEGDLITVLEQPENSEWWKGELNGQTGLFPSNFTQPKEK